MSLAVPLHRYAARTATPVGLFRPQPSENPRYACREVWTQPQRGMVSGRSSRRRRSGRSSATPGTQVAGGGRHPATCPVRSRWGRCSPRGLADTVIEAGWPSTCGGPGDGGRGPGESRAGGRAPVSAGDRPGGDADRQDRRLHRGGHLLDSWARLVAWDCRHNPPEGWLYADVATWGPRPSTCGPSRTTQRGEPRPEVRALRLNREAACLQIERGMSACSRGRTETCASHRPEWIELHYLAGMTP